MCRKLKSGIKILEWRCCKGKEKYTEQEAIIQLRIARAHDPSLNKYGPCKRCGHFHLGHKRLEQQT